MVLKEPLKEIVKKNNLLFDTKALSFDLRKSRNDLISLKSDRYF